MQRDVAAPPEGSFKLCVHLPRSDQEGVVTISATNDVNDLRTAIYELGRNSFFKDRDALELIVKPTRAGRPLTASRTKLSAVKFEREADDDSLHVYVELRPKPEGAANTNYLQTRLGWQIIDTIPDAIPKSVTFVGDPPAHRFPNPKFTNNIDFLPWDDFLTEVKDWNPKPFLCYPIELPLWTNIESRMAGEEDLAQVVSHILRIVSLASGTTLHGQMTSSPKRDEDSTGEVRGTRPNFTFTRDENPIAVVQIKAPQFGGGNSLARLARLYGSEVVEDDDKLVTSAFATLQQHNTYLEKSNVTVGVISDYAHFWFVRKVQKEEEGDEGDENEQATLRVSEALPCQSNAPTVLRALGYVVSLAIQDFQATPRAPSDDANAAFVDEKHVEPTDPKQTPSNKPDSKKRKSEHGGKTGGHPPAPMHSLGFGR